MPEQNATKSQTQNWVQRSAIHIEWGRPGTPRGKRRDTFFFCLPTLYRGAQSPNMARKQAMTPRSRVAKCSMSWPKTRTLFTARQKYTEKKTMKKCSRSCRLGTSSADSGRYETTSNQIFEGGKLSRSQQDANTKLWFQSAVYPRSVVGVQSSWQKIHSIDNIHQGLLKEKGKLAKARQAIHFSPSTLCKGSWLPLPDVAVRQRTSAISRPPPWAKDFGAH